MNQWAFVIGAYALTFLGTGLISLFSWRAMRSAESRASADAISADRA
ncbi:hypothetical protein M527_06055 [Sphingobium indicum IP26]|nr:MULTISPECIES: hypothetical protein [Sphingobium]EPR09689.1 hypothetical protein M527_06055 [Sphingobium indicum IP26]EQB04878.1 hypothetical protein L286_08895 [Sphingobium sp. HDIP04]